MYRELWSRNRETKYSLLPKVGSNMSDVKGEEEVEGLISKETIDPRQLIEETN